ncbi:HAD family hydrolase [Leptospira perdikensis]|uniref:phosphoglycolate phosphatase n=1 Tax=Leptospira perdikensis TaxID=2484948 RepID=A0A4R9JLY9_9LEPT|nr:HAD hydrolase-like protein [Leptospira perdikensis]TGL45821.1 HAD family hydrolase [Leptospira perdikensis]
MNLNTFSKYKIIFWDFDGVIKDSVRVKLTAYKSLFPDANQEILQKIENHHLENGGMSRFKKIPLYLDWNSLPCDQNTIEVYQSRFAESVIQAVIDSAWIEGVELILRSKKENQLFVIVTGTPQEEIDVILKRLDIIDLFDRVYGAPTEKDRAIQLTLSDWKTLPQDTLLIGDSESDFKAAEISGSNFIFVDNAEESGFSKKYTGIRIRNFKGML